MAICDPSRSSQHNRHNSETGVTYECVNEECEEDDRAARLDKTVHASPQRRVGESDGREDGRRVCDKQVSPLPISYLQYGYLTVVDRGSARPSLPHEHNEDQNESIAHSLHDCLSRSAPQEGAESWPVAMSHSLLVRDLALHKHHIFKDILVVDGKIADVAQDFVCLFVPATLQ